MVEQADRLIGNLLAGGVEVFLPGVGSLYTERCSAKRLSKRMVMPPCRVVSFSSQQRGVSLVDEIERTIREADTQNTPQAEALRAQAQDIYDRWLSRTLKDGTLTVEGVGILKSKNFTLDKAFDLRLNPQGHEPVRIKGGHRFDWALCVGGVAMLLAALVGGYELLTFYSDEKAPATVVAEKGVAQTADLSAAEHADSLAAQQTPAPTGVSDTAATPATASRTSQSAGLAGTEQAPASLVSGRRYVVLGVFSTAENAGRAARDAAKKDASFRCGIYRFGEKFMISPFGSDDAEACREFIREHADRFSGMWTYNAR